MSRLAIFLVVFVAALGASAQEITPEKRDEALGLIEEGTDQLERGRIAEAAESFRRAGGLNPFEVLVPFRLAQCEIAFGLRGGDPVWVGRAFRRLEEALKVDPEFPETYFLWGVIGARVGEYEAALFGFGEALRRGYRITDSRVGFAQALLGQGLRLVRDGVKEEITRRILEDASDRLLVLKEDARFDSATRRGFREQWVRARTALAIAYREAAEPEKAEKILLSLIEHQPESREHRLELGRLYETSRRWEEALAACRKALELSPDPDWVEPYPVMATAHSRQKEKAAAEERFRAYFDRYPDDGGALLRLGEHHALFGETEPAIAAFLRCVEIGPGGVTAMRRLAALLTEAGREAEAKKWLDLAMALEAG